MVHHARGLLRLTKDEALVEAIKADYTTAKITDAERAMLDYALKLTRTPGDMERADVERLREAGFSDRAIHDVALVAGYFAFVNRISDGLGVELESYWPEDVRQA